MRVVIIAPFMRWGQEVLESLRALRPDVNYSVVTKSDQVRGQRPDLFIMCHAYGDSSPDYPDLIDMMRLIAYRCEIPVTNAIQAHHEWMRYSAQAKQGGEEQTE